jgi:hypothetical protein
MRSFWIPILFIAGIGILLGINWLVLRKAKRLVYAWAARNGLQIIEMELRWFSKGPFFWTTSRTQIVYYVTVYETGRRRQAYVRCGSFWLGMISDRVEVSWEGI